MHQLNFLLASVLFVGLSLMLSPVVSYGQESVTEKEVKVKIVQKINGDETIIEKSYMSGDLDELKDLLKEFKLDIDEEELLDEKEVEISIRKTDAKADEKKTVIRVEKINDEEMGNVLSTPKAYLGVVADDVSENADDAESTGKGIVVAKVMKESAADKAGLKEGDFITKANDTEITGSKQFRETIRSLKAGEEAVIHYQRDGKENTVKAVLGEKAQYGRQDYHGWQGKMERMQFRSDETDHRPFFGVTPGEFLEENRKQSGVMIGDVFKKSTADEMGLQKGDIVTKMNDKALNTFDELREAVANTKVGEKLKAEWKRDGKTMKASADMKSKAECREAFMSDKADWIPHCGSMGMKDYKHQWKESKETTKENLEKSIERLENKITDMKKQLEEMTLNEENMGMNIEEKTVTITIEDVSTNTLDAKHLYFAPNPNSGKFNLSFELPGTEKTTVKILDAANKEVYSETLDRFSGRYEKQFDLSENPKGIYFLQITQDKKILNKKIVIQ